MLLLFKPRDPKYVGDGTLAFGSFDDTKQWLPITRYLEKGAEMFPFPDKTMFRVADRHENLAVGIRLPNVSDDEMKLNIILRPGVSFDPVEFCKWTAHRSPVFMVPCFIEIYPQGVRVTATQKVKMAELKETIDKTWDRSKVGVKFSVLE